MMLSAGTPLMAGGDEYLRSLHCNNNAYNVDSVANWLNYTWTADQSNFNAFAKGMIAFRKAHAALRPLNFYSNAQLVWWTPAGATPDATYFGDSSNHSIAWQFNGAALNDSYSSIYVAYNGWSANVNFTLPSPGQGLNWYRVTDTCGRATKARTKYAPRDRRVYWLTRLCVQRVRSRSAVVNCKARDYEMNAPEIPYDHQGREFGPQRVRRPACWQFTGLFCEAAKPAMLGGFDGKLRLFAIPDARELGRTVSDGRDWSQRIAGSSNLKRRKS